MHQLKQTPLFDRHVSLQADMVEFSGWEMPIKYPSGIIEEHLATRKGAGLFDISHMGRFLFKGDGAVDLLQHLLSNNALNLNPEGIGAQYTIIPTESGGAVDDAYLYHFNPVEFLLVVNACNREKDWHHFQSYLSSYPDVKMTDQTEETAMLALQGPTSENILNAVVDHGPLPEFKRNATSVVSIHGKQVMISRTGYTGEPICFELFIPGKAVSMLWDLLLENGAAPVGLGARDTLRLEAGLPLYGNEMGIDLNEREIPILANPKARNAVSFSDAKGDFIGRSALLEQVSTLKSNDERHSFPPDGSFRLIRPIRLTEKGIARSGYPVYNGNQWVGYVTSGTRVPFWTYEKKGSTQLKTDIYQLRSIGLAYIDRRISESEHITVDIRGRRVAAELSFSFLDCSQPPYAIPMAY